MNDARERSYWLAAPIVIVAAVVLGALAWLRYSTFHNETFDLAFYARIAWGLAKLELYEPMLDTSVLGLHLAWVLVPLGWIGRLVGCVPTLLFAQTLAFAATGILLARFGHRRLGVQGAFVAAIAWCAYPNLSHVFTFEFHPGNLALPFFVWAIDAIDRGAHKQALGALLIATLCREDLALALVPLSMLGAHAHRAQTRARNAYLVAAGALAAYFAYFLFVAQPAHAPQEGSLALHFGPWGRSVGQMLGYVLAHPSALAAHLADDERAFYVLQILAPVAVLPAVLGARWLLPALPIVIVNLLSHFPGTTRMDSHYLTPALPFVVAAALEGLSRVPRKSGLAVFTMIASLAGSFLAGGYPYARAYDAAAFEPDARTLTARQAIALVPAGASVQAPYALLPHLAERKIVRRGPPPDHATDVVILDAWQRSRYLHDENLIRTDEEPVTRDWMAKPRRKLVGAFGDYLVLVRGNPRDGIGARAAIVGRADPASGQTLTRCLGLLGARLDGDALMLDFVARDACGADLAVRLGEGDRPRRVDLLFGGLFSPAHLRAGDHMRSRHRLSEDEKQSWLTGRMRLGLIRQSGARPDAWDHNSIPIGP